MHADLKATLACDYLDEMVDGGRAAKRFRLKAQQYLTTPSEQSHRDGADILDALEKKGHIAPGKYGELKELVKPVDMRMVKVIEDTEKQMGDLESDAVGKIIRIHSDIIFGFSEIILTSQKLSKLKRRRTIYYRYENHNKMSAVVR